MHWAVKMFRLTKMFKFV